MKMNLQILLLFTSIITMFSCKKSETTTTTNTNSYSKFKINSVTLNAFPSTDNGSNWDLLGISDPDMYFNIDSAGTQLYSGSNNAYQNNLTQSNLPFSWPALPSPQVINNLSYTYFINLFDADNPTIGDSDDSMGQIPFVMNDHKTGYPSSFQITNGTSTVTIIGTWY